jgi:hypothetical protein
MKLDFLSSSQNPYISVDAACDSDEADENRMQRMSGDVS